MLRPSFVAPERSDGSPTAASSPQVGARLGSSAFYLPHLVRSSQGRTRRAEGKGRRSERADQPTDAVLDRGDVRHDRVDVPQHLRQQERMMITEPADQRLLGPEGDLDEMARI